jgi:TetR/AcrR family transcriptional regulator of autoinduction and epiphytic fitness
MAQRSKKDLIIQTALPLFLEHGFKGTSVDLVVKISGVSKPTVYNHFPDKAALMHSVIETWVSTHQPKISPIDNALALNKVMEEKWLTSETLNLYALVIGEGRRFPEAKHLFWDSFDNNWQKALIDSTDKHALPIDLTVNLLMDQHLISQLKKI